MVWTLKLDGLSGGTIRGLLTADGQTDAPVLEMVADGQGAGTVRLTRVNGGWTVEASLAPEVLSDGIVVVVFRLQGSEAPLAVYPIQSGPARPNTDTAQELALLRAEFEALKRAFLKDASVPKLRAAERSLIVAEAAEEARTGRGSDAPR